MLMPTDTFFTRRRTVRRYSGRQLSDDTLRELFEEASHAPTTGNMQLYSAVVTRSAEMKRRLAPMHFGQPQFQGCQAAVTVCADLRRFTRWCEISGAEAGFDNLQMFFAGVLDAAMFAQQLCTAAESRGLGTCYLGTTTYNAPEIAEALSLPQLVVPVTTVTVGYPDECPADPGRLPVEAIMHQRATRTSPIPVSASCMPTRRPARIRGGSSRKTRLRISRRYSPGCAIRGNPTNASRSRLRLLYARPASISEHH